MSSEIGQREIVAADVEEEAQLAVLKDEGYKAKIERGIIIHVEAFDWNCPAHITPRYTEAELLMLAN